MAQASTPKRPSIAVVIPNAREVPDQLVSDLAEQSRVGDELVLAQNRPDRDGSVWFGRMKGQDVGSRFTSPAEERLVRESATRPNLRVVFSAPGAAAARNAGWRSVGAEWVLFLDDDVGVPGDFLDAVRVRAAQRAADVTTFRIRERGSSIPATQILLLDRGVDARSTEGRRLHLSETWQYGTGAAILARRGLLEEMGGFKDELGAGRRDGGAEDLEFLWHASRHCSVEYRGDIYVEHDAPRTLSEVGHKMRCYGRALALLAGAAGPSEGLGTIRDYCDHLLRSVKMCTARHSEKCARRTLNTFAYVAAAETVCVGIRSLLIGSRNRTLCASCRAS
jgi:hypothetical protein